MKVAMIGSRHISESEDKLNYEIAQVLVSFGIKVATGGALGTDKKSARGALDYLHNNRSSAPDFIWRDYLQNHLEISLPWHGFNGLSDLPHNHIYDTSEYPKDIRRKAVELARLHPRLAQFSLDDLLDPPRHDHELYEKIRPALPMRDLMARNSHIILGKELDDPVDLVICTAFGTTYDKRNKICDVSGGTGHGVRLAYDRDIPVLNLRVPLHRSIMKNTLILCEHKRIRSGAELIEDLKISLERDELKGD